MVLIKSLNFDKSGAQKMSVKSDDSISVSFVTRLRNRIAGTDFFYLAGPIESKKAKQQSGEWREQYASDLEELGNEVGFNLRTFDPSKEEPDLLGYSFEGWGNLKTALRIKKDFKTFRKMMSAVIHLDLKKITRSRMLIIRWKNEIPAVGTMHELLYARDLGIPTVIIFEDKREEMNPWLDCLTAELNINIFYSWPEFLADLHDKYNHGFTFAFYMRFRRIVKSLSVFWRKFILRLINMLAPRPFSNFSGKRSSRVYDSKFPEESAKRRIIFLIGPPLYGKTTQAEELAKLLNLRHIETSQLIREAISMVPDNMPEGIDRGINLYGHYYSLVEEKRKYDAKELNDSNFVFGLITHALEEARAANDGVVFSGSPRKIQEADKLIPILREMFPDALFSAFELTNLPKKVLLQRAAARQRALGFDTPEAIAHRMEIFEEQTRPVIKHVENQHGISVKKIKANQSIAHVTRLILQEIE